MSEYKKVKILIISIMISFMVKSQNFKSLKNINLNTFKIVEMTNTSLRMESQYSKNSQFFSAYEPSYSRLNIETGIVLFGFIPISAEGFYTTEKQNLFQENYFRVNFDLDLLIQENKKKAQSRLESENRKLVYYKRDIENKKKIFNKIKKTNDSIADKLNIDIKKLMNDTINSITANSKVQLDKYKNTDNIKNNIPEIINDSIKSFNKNIEKDISEMIDKSDYLKDSVNNLKKQYRLKKADSILKKIEILRIKEKESEKELSQMNDSIKKIEKNINEIIQIIKNPRQKLENFKNKKIKLPKTFKIGRINPYFSESVLNGTPAKGILVEFDKNKITNSFSIGKLSEIPQLSSKADKFQTMYFAFKTMRKTDNMIFETGIFNCIKEIPQGNRIYAIPFGNLLYMTKSGFTFKGEFAKSFSYQKETYEIYPESILKTGYALNLLLKYNINLNSDLKLTIENSSTNYQSPGNPFYISGPLKLQFEYSQSFMKDKIKLDIGIRKNTVSKYSGKFSNQTFSLRLKSNFKKGLNISVSYLPIQNKAVYTNEKTGSSNIETNILNTMIIFKKKYTGYLFINNTGYWTISESGLLPDFQSINLYNNFYLINSKNNKITFSCNLGKKHILNDTLNNSSARITTEYNVKDIAIFTLNSGYVKYNMLQSQFEFLAGFRKKTKIGDVWFESGGQKTGTQKLNYIGRLNYNINF